MTANLGLGHKCLLNPVHTQLPTKGLLGCGQSNMYSIATTLIQPTAPALILQRYDSTLQAFTEASGDNTNSPPPWPTIAAPAGQSAFERLLTGLRAAGETAALWAVNAGVPATSSTQWAGLPNNPTSLLGIAGKRYREMVRNAPAPFVAGPMIYSKWSRTRSAPRPPRTPQI